MMPRFDDSPHGAPVIDLGFPLLPRFMSKLGMFLLCLLPALSQTGVAQGYCLSPPGDLTGDGTTDVVDTQCAILAALWALTGSQTAAPNCLPTGSNPIAMADQNCDAMVGVADAQLVIFFALGTPLAASLDADSNQCVDVCEVDTDGDGDPDVVDCAPNDPKVSSGEVEVCNGKDDNCNGQVDEALGGSAQGAMGCDDGDPCTDDACKGGGCVSVPKPGCVAVSCASKALLLDGKSCIEVPDVLTEGFDEYTIEFWVYPVTTEIRFVLDKVVNKNNTVPGWRIRAGNLVGGIQKIHYEEVKSNGNFHGALSSDNSVPTDKWTHYAITRDKAGQLKVYVNGFSPGPLSVAAKLIPDQSNATPLYIGCQDNTDGYFIGMIDELRISSTLRYTANFSPKTTAFGPDNDTMLLMHFDGEGDWVADFSGQGHHGTYLGTPAYGSGSIVSTWCEQ